jgi:hypothetical protein
VATASVEPVGVPRYKVTLDLSKEGARELLSLMAHLCDGTTDEDWQDTVFGELSPVLDNDWPALVTDMGYNDSPLLKFRRA